MFTESKRITLNTLKMIRLYFRIWLLLVIILSVNKIYAQNNTYTLTGTIIDNRSSIPLFYVSTGLLNETDSAVVSVALTEKRWRFYIFQRQIGDIHSKNFIHGI